MLINCLAACAHLRDGGTVSEIQRDIREKIGNFSYTLVFDAPVRGVPIEISAPPLVLENQNGVASEKIQKISLFVLAQLRNVTDRQTDGHRVTPYTALIHMHRAVKREGKLSGGYVRIPTAPAKRTEYQLSLLLSYFHVATCNAVHMNPVSEPFISTILPLQ